MPEETPIQTKNTRTAQKGNKIRKGQYQAEQSFTAAQSHITTILIYYITALQQPDNMSDTIKQWQSFGA